MRVNDYLRLKLKIYVMDSVRFINLYVHVDMLVSILTVSEMRACYTIAYEKSVGHISNLHNYYLWSLSEFIMTRIDLHDASSVP